jgi:hypothetical protein
MSLQTRIRRGIKLLDAANPDWHYRVQPDNLRMQFTDECVLGQLYGDYDDGRGRLSLSDYQSYRHGFLSLFQLFVNVQGVPLLGRLVGRRLNKAWTQAIFAKRAEDETVYKWACENATYQKNPEVCLKKLESGL